MVHNAEQDRVDALKRSAFIEKHRGDYEDVDRQAQLDKISQLEREHLKLTATQTLAEVRLNRGNYSCVDFKNFKSSTFHDTDQFC